MEIEQTENIVLYKFNWIEHAVINAVLKHLDRQRRAGELINMPVHSATRAIYSDDVPRDESARLVRWIVDEDEYSGSSPDEACSAPAPHVLAELMQFARNEIASGNESAYNRRIGRIVVAQSGISSETTYFNEPLVSLSTQIEQFSNIIENA